MIRIVLPLVLGLAAVLAFAISHADSQGIPNVLKWAPNSQYLSSFFTLSLPMECQKDLLQTSEWFLL